MSRYDHRDILMELLELCREQKSAIVQQLTYYRASVYKTETAKVIEKKVEQLRTAAMLIGDALLLDAFHDYEETKRSGQQMVAPGECFLSTRVMNLVIACDKIFDQLQDDIHLHQGDRQLLTRNVQKHRNQLLSMCRQGTRQWSFFSSL